MIQTKVEPKKHGSVALLVVKNTQGTFKLPLLSFSRQKSVFVLAGAHSEETLPSVFLLIVDSEGRNQGEQQGKWEERSEVETSPCSTPKVRYTAVSKSRFSWDPDQSHADKTHCLSLTYVVLFDTHGSSIPTAFRLFNFSDVASHDNITNRPYPLPTYATAFFTLLW